MIINWVSKNWRSNSPTGACYPDIAAVSTLKLWSIRCMPRPLVRLEANSRRGVPGGSGGIISAEWHPLKIAKKMPGGKGLS